MPDDIELQTTASGLKYSVLKPGDGSQHPQHGDRVRVHYSGWTTDGKLFDSSVKRGEPAEFGLGQVIEGWNEGVCLMTVGARYKFTIPPALAYGEEGRPPVIPPRAELVFEVELLDIVARAMPYVAWDDEQEVERGESGLRFRYLARGEGRPAREANLVKLEYALYDPQGKPVLSSSMDGQTLLASTDRLPLAFMQEAVGFMREGDRVLLSVPPALGFTGQAPPGFDPKEPTLWQLELGAALTFDKPTFSMPKDGELQTTASGLRYRVLREGSGKKPSERSQVAVHYQGWLTDGTAFDGSYDRGEIATFPLNGVIGGWTEGLQLVGDGGQILLVVPPDLGYGKVGSPPVIPPDATLVFFVELVQFQG